MFASLKQFHGAVKGFFTLVRDPEQTDQVFVIGRAMQHTGQPERMAARLSARSPEIRQLITERYLPQPADLDRLMELPEGSLGRTFAEHMRRSGFTVEFYPKWEIDSDGSYLTRRIQQTHDIWHTVLGFGTDPAGELGLQAFMLVQLHTPLSAVLLSGGLLRCLQQPEAFPVILHQVRRGIRLGRTLRPLLAQRWEDGWDRPLSAWRADVSLASA